VDEGIFAAVIRLNEAKSLGGVEPFNGTCSHSIFPFMVCQPADILTLAPCCVLHIKARKERAANATLTAATAK
jgi:hypothetical protein